MEIIKDLIEEGWLKTENIISAFKEIDRIDFLPKQERDLAELNQALPIGKGQTISQPLVVAFMIEELKPEPGNKILDVGSGSGWTTTLLSHIVGKDGRVFGIEIVPELKEFGEKNCSKYSFVKKGIAKFILADGSKGYEKEAPFDRILISAAVQDKIPLFLKQQLKVGGIMVLPVRSSIWVLEKNSETELKETEYTGFSFVPLIEK